MLGNSHARFLGGDGPETGCPYPTVCVPPGSLRGAKNSAKAAFDGNPLGGKLNGFLFLRSAQGRR